MARLLDYQNQITKAGLMSKLDLTSRLRKISNYLESKTLKYIVFFKNL